MPRRTEVINEEFGLWLRRQRMAHGWTQEQFADIAGVSRTTIGPLERGALSPHTPMSLLLKLTEALGVEFGYLLFKAGMPINRDGVDMERLRAAESIGEAYGAIEYDLRSALAETLAWLSTGDGEIPRECRKSVVDRLRVGLLTLDLATTRLKASGYLLEPPATTAVSKNAEWTEAETQFVREHPEASHAELASRLGRSPESVRYFRRQFKAASPDHEEVLS